MPKNILIVSAYSSYTDYNLSELAQKYAAEHTVEFAHSYTSGNRELFKFRDHVIINVDKLPKTQNPDERFSYEFLLSEEERAAFSKLEDQNKPYFLAHRLVTDARRMLHDKTYITVILNGFSANYGKNEFELAGANSFLEKPETPEAKVKLLQELEKIIES